MMFSPTLPALKYSSMPASQPGGGLFLQVVIDTEEEFDWRGQPDQAARSVQHFKHLPALHAIFKDHGIQPFYVVDHPVASDPLSVGVLRAWLKNNECGIGAHLHPWVNPPFSERLSVANMYPGNLPPELEFEKLVVLKRTIEDAFDVSPRAYKAGRYGFGPHTASHLHRLGVDLDLSFMPTFDMRADGGPNHASIPTVPFWLTQPNASPILSMPGTAAILGGLPQLYPLASLFNKRLRVPGILARLRLADRIKLSPEGYSITEMMALTHHLIRKGVTVFTLSLHSSSVMVGGSPYADTADDVALIFERCAQYCHFFMNQLGGTPTNPDHLKTLIARLP